MRGIGAFLALSVLLVALGCVPRGNSRRPGKVVTMNDLSPGSLPPHRGLGQDDPLFQIKCKTARWALEEFFSSASREKIYVEQSPYLPKELTRIGESEAEIVTREELARRFQGRKLAPSITTVHVYHSERDPGDHFRVDVSIMGLMIEGAEAVPLGGGMGYTFRIQNDRAVLVNTSQWFL